ncbi:MAG: class I SAM-dependent methyltransferase [Dehalococcoidia bacterium]|nr:class I SAM-dependent methyltransferase [Dehalococcoidia bacterium]
MVALFGARNVRRVLDLGCGAGRHVIYLAQKGYEVYGLDSSAEGLKMAGELLAETNLTAELASASMYKPLPYPDSFFDALVCTKALNHGAIESIRRAIREMERVLKPGGILFLVVTEDEEAMVVAGRLGTGTTGFFIFGSLFLQRVRLYWSIRVLVDSSKSL